MRMSLVICAIYSKERRFERIIRREVIYETFITRINKGKCYFRIMGEYAISFNSCSKGIKWTNERAVF